MMTTADVKAQPQETFQTVMAAAERAAEIPAEDDVYGFLVGCWDLDVLHYGGIDVAARGTKGEVVAGRVLEGRAVQDVWIMPRRAERGGEIDRTNNMFGTTIRVWDAAIKAWRITWINPVNGHREEQIGRRVGADIVQTGMRFDGTLTRWMFTEMTPDAFHWTGWALNADGATWRLEGEFRATRRR